MTHGPTLSNLLHLTFGYNLGVWLVKPHFLINYFHVGFTPLRWFWSFHHQPLHSLIMAKNVSHNCHQSGFKNIIQCLEILCFILMNNSHLSFAFAIAYQNWRLCLKGIGLHVRRLVNYIYIFPPKQAQYSEHLTTLVFIYCQSCPRSSQSLSLSLSIAMFASKNLEYWELLLNSTHNMWKCQF